METSGWVIMIISVGFVTSFFGWSLYLVFTRKPNEDE